LGIRQSPVGGAGGTGCGGGQDDRMTGWIGWVFRHGVAVVPGVVGYAGGVAAECPGLPRQGPPRELREVESEPQQGTRLLGLQPLPGLFSFCTRLTRGCFAPRANGLDASGVHTSTTADPESGSCLDHGFHEFHGWTGLEWRFSSRQAAHLAGVRQVQPKSLPIRVIRAIRGSNCIFQADFTCRSLRRHLPIRRVRSAG